MGFEAYATKFCHHWLNPNSTYCVLVQQTVITRENAATTLYKMRKGNPLTFLILTHFWMHRILQHIIINKQF